MASKSSGVSQGFNVNTPVRVPFCLIPFKLVIYMSCIVLKERKTYVELHKCQYVIFGSKNKTATIQSINNIKDPCLT